MKHLVYITPETEWTFTGYERLIAISGGESTGEDMPIDDINPFQL